MQRVSHAVAFGLEITLVIFVWRNLDGHILNDFQSVCLQSDTLHGVVGEQAHLVYAEVAQHLSATSVVALVGLESEVHVSVHCVVTLFLQLVCGNLVHQTNAATFLLHVDKHTLALALNHLHCLMELFAAVAALATEDVASGA